MISKQQTPKIRFTDFSEDWAVQSMEGFGSSVGGTSLESEFKKTGKYKVISIGSYSKNSTYIDQGIRVQENEKTRKKILNKNDLAMVLNDKTLAGNIIGRALLIDEDEKYVFNQRTQRLILDQQKYYPKFIYQMLNANKIRRKIVKSSQGNTQIYVNWSGVKSLIYTLPNSLQEQTAIGNLFQDIDQTIALQRRKHEQMQSLKKSLLSKMFPKKGQKQPEIRLEDFSGDWLEVELEDVVEIVGGGTPDTNNPYFWNGNIDWYSPTEIGKKVYADKSVKTITELGLLKSSAQILPANKTVLFTSRAGIGDMAILRKDGATNQGFQSFIVKDIDVYFLYSMGSILKEKAIKKASGSTFLEISKTQLKVIELSIPSDKSEQTVIGQFFKQLDDTLSLQAKQLKTLDNLKQALLAKIFV